MNRISLNDGSNILNGPQGALKTRKIMNKYVTLSFSIIKTYGLGSLTSKKGTQFFCGTVLARSIRTGWRAQRRWKVGRFNLSNLPTAHIKLAGPSVGTTWSSCPSIYKNKCSFFVACYIIKFYWLKLLLGMRDLRYVMTVNPSTRDPK